MPCCASGDGPEGVFKNGCKGGCRRSEKRLGGNVWWLQTGWTAIAGRKKWQAGLTVNPNGGAPPPPFSSAHLGPTHPV